MVSVRHRIVIKITCHNSLQRTLLYVCHYLLHLLGAADDLPFHLLLRVFQAVVVVLGYGFREGGKRDVVTLKMTVVDS